MPPLLVGKVLGFPSALVVALGHFIADLNGHHAPIDFDGNFHLDLPPFRFLAGVWSERRRRGTALRHDVSTKQ